MQIDPNLFPTTFDVVHLGLAALVVVLLILQIVLLSVGLIALLRRKKSEAPVSVVIEKVPPSLLPEPPAMPVRIVIEKVPAEMIPPAPQVIREALKPIEPPKIERPEPVIVKEATPDAALQLLGLLQKEARFLDFVQEDVVGYADSEIGAAVRVVHEGCRKVLKQHFELEPVRKESEGTRLTLPKGFDPATVRVSGNIVGSPPFTGTLIHRGWRAAQVKLPKIAEGHDTHIIASAEVEL
ncbi:DUF2760 domain-containing protein [Methylomagnum sp.]